MSYLLYLKKDQEDPTPFKLYEYGEPDGGRLHVPTTLQKLELASLEVQEPGTDLYVPVAFHTQTGLSLDKFKANTQQAPLSVAGTAQVVPAPVLPGDGWRQQDMMALHPVDGRVLMYANIIVVNDRVQPPVECRMRALVDTGAGQELIIPPRKAQQLQLLERSRGQLKGFEEGSVGVIKYAPVLVKLPSDDSSGQERTFKQADLTIYAKDIPLAQQEDLREFAGLRQPQPLSPEGNLQLTPVNSPPRGDIATAILGMQGLRKLHVTVKPDQALLCPRASADEWLVV